jgi:UDP-N-acetylmuramoylalanine--D-glutamate ligase
MERSQIRLRGEHNLENVLAAAAAAFLVGVEPEAIARACRSFAGVEHRLEWIRDLEGVSFYNDSKATNVESASKAMEALEQPLVAIMGGTNKGSDFRVLRPLVKSKVRHLVLLGEARESLMEGLRGTAPVSEVGGLEEAVRRAFVEALPGDAVLLAPACASFDMFRNYEDRGRAFKDLVSQLTGSERQ